MSAFLFIVHLDYSPLLLSTAFAMDQESGGLCLPTEDGRPGLRMALTIIDPTVPGTSVSTNILSTTTTENGIVYIMLHL